MYPRPGSNRHGFKGQGILSPSCLPIPPLRHLHKKSRLPSGPCGAENETRTRDPDLGKVVLYQLSYFRFASRIGFSSRLGIIKLHLLLLSLLRKHRIALSGKRDSNSRPRPWQGRALPTELFPLANCGAKVQLFSIPQTFLRKFFFLCSFFADFASNGQTIPTIFRQAQ